MPWTLLRGLKMNLFARACMRNEPSSKFWLNMGIVRNFEDVKKLQ